MYMKNNKKRNYLPSKINKERPRQFYFLNHVEFTNQQKYV